MAAQVPPEISASNACAGEGDSTSGCGTINGRASGSEVADMEKRLQANQAASAREIEIKLPANRSSSTREEVSKRQNAPSIHDKRKGRPKKVNKQVMGRCEKCGYISSQSICKACVLLDGLNKARPTTNIEVSAEEEESTTLMRHVAALEIGAS